MEKIKLTDWKRDFKASRWLVLLSALIVITAHAIQTVASTYVDLVASSSVTDLILDNIPSLDLSFLFVYWWGVVTLIFIFYPFVYRINRFHIYMGQFSLLILVRSFFIG